jgi:hypothetical protein
MILRCGADSTPHRSVPVNSESYSLARYAFSVLRSRMTATTVPRWGKYSDYLELLIHITDLARSYSGGQWRRAFREDGPNNVYRSRDAILRPEQLAWLYNEIVLTHYLQGSSVDALGIWQQGYEINRLVDSNESIGEYIFQSYCNLGAANIQYGPIDGGLIVSPGRPRYESSPRR